MATNCDGFTFVDSSNSTYPATYAIDIILGAYDLQCLYDSSDAEYCGPVVNSYNATGGLLSLPNDELCTFCTLETLNLTLSNPTTFSYPLQELLSEAVQQCGSCVELPYAANLTVLTLRPVHTTPTTLLASQLAWWRPLRRPASE